MFGLTPFNKQVVRSTSERDPFRDMIDDFFKDDFFPMRSLRYDTFKIDVREEDNAFMIDADLPGIKKEDIKIEYHDGMMTISIEHEENKNEETKTYIHRERKACSMTRTLDLGDLDESNIQAELKDGVLSIKAPKATVVQKKKHIEIK